MNFSHPSRFLSLVLLVTGCSASDGLQSQTIKATNSVTNYPGEGGVVISNSNKGDDSKTVCVAPPSIAALKSSQALSGKASVNIKENQNVGAEASSNSSREGTTLFTPSDRVLFLQFALYRLCEGYMNGVLTKGKEDGPSSTVPLFVPLWRDAQDSLILLESAEKKVEDAKKELGKVQKELADIKEKLTDCETKKKAYEGWVKGGKKSPEPPRVEKCEDIEKAGKEAEGKVQASKRRVDEAIAERGQVATALEKLHGRLLAMADAPANYQISAFIFGFMEVMRTSQKLAENDIKVVQAEAEKAKAEAEKAKADLEKEKLKSEADKSKKELEELKVKAVNKLLEDKKEDKKSEDEKSKK